MPTATHETHELRREGREMVLPHRLGAGTVEKTPSASVWCAGEIRGGRTWLTNASHQGKGAEDGAC
jgi:hypothetical protein